jgi:hypothetical protein
MSLQAHLKSAPAMTDISLMKNRFQADPEPVSHQ